MPICFSLNAAQIAALQSLAQEGESLNLVAKRLLLSILNYPQAAIKPQDFTEKVDQEDGKKIYRELREEIDERFSDQSDTIREINCRLEALEISYQALLEKKTETTTADSSN
ncbi:hypothetical protein IQ232_01890 [Microcystis aeruginosa LEGE 11464]|jgi:hypothetical protein|uniref:hypothetical protein n=1 Tax=Microcystis aeruginosa TaxID=1126 RepID=UPI00187F1E3A|nr:hypothetical protein [Microcystis aeruginosa]MBE9088574.1 hypothetical protein [Microcystis aeruginosa LEGE 11464]NCR55602.1 hypothetical protein [Microcystis aeruginosa L211-07]